MTISLQTSSTTHTGNGVTTAFSVPFMFHDADDLVVTRIEISTLAEIELSAAAYTVTPAEDEDGGTVTYLMGGAPLSSLYKLRIDRATPLTQLLSISREGVFDPTALEDQLDRQVMMTQEIREQVAVVERLVDTSVSDVTIAAHVAASDPHPVYLLKAAAPLSYATRAAVEAADLPTLTTGQTMYVRGHTTEGVGGATYIKLGSTPSPVKAWHLQSDDGAYWEIFEPVVTVQMLGARGNGSTNDSSAFRALADYVTAKGGNVTVSIPPPASFYLVGEQEFAGAGGLGYAYRGKDNFSLSGIDNVTILWFGGKIKNASGMRHGSFNPTTGISHTASLPFVDTNYAASLSPIFKFVECDNLVMLGANALIDGNIAGNIKGGDWGDTGIQCSADGIWLQDCKNPRVEGIDVTETGRDGLLYIYDQQSDNTALVRGIVQNCSFTRAARNNASLVGGTFLTFRNCAFNEAGRSTYTSAPAAGVDIEEEHYISTNVIRDLVFENCVFADNVAAGAIAATGDTFRVNFNNCSFYGTTSYSANVQKPGFTFVDCLFSGEALFNYVGDNDQRPHIIRGRFAPRQWGGRPVYGNFLLTVGTANGNALFDECTFDTMSTTKALPATSAGAVTWRNVLMTSNGAANTALPKGHFEGRNVISLATVSDAANFFGSTKSPEAIIEKSGSGTASALPFNERELGTTSYEWQYERDGSQLIFLTPITEDIAVTASATGNRAGYAKLKVTRGTSSTGAFVIDVLGAKSLAAGQWCEVYREGASSAWRLAAFGSL